MTMQLLELVLYGKRGQKRSVAFEPGRVNIITGGSATGKSAIIDVVDYCLGSRKCRVPAGPIRDAVSWYGLTITTGSSRMFVGRAGPGDKKSPSDAMITEGADARSPKAEPVANTTTGAVLTALAQKIGIVPNLHMPQEGQTRQPLKVTFRHALRFCLQQQDEIATKISLFHNANSFEDRATADTLPYFLGAVRDDYLDLYGALMRAKRAHRQTEIDLKQADSIRGDEMRRGKALLDEAVVAGIVGKSEAHEAGDDIRPILAKAASWAPGTRDEPTPPRLSEMQDAISGIETQLGDLSEQIKAARAFAGESAGYRGEVRRQSERLKSIGLFAGGDEADSCPLCSAPLAGRVAGAAAMHDSLRQLQKSLKYAEMEEPRLRELIDTMEDERASLSGELGRKREALRSLIAASDRLARLREQDLVRAQVSGRVSFWLDHVYIVDEDSALRSKAGEAKRAVEEIEGKIGDDVTKRKMDKIVSAIGGDIGVRAKRLRLEHSEWPVRFDPRRLTVIADADGTWIPLREMGSAQNWLGYHLAVHLALHGHFAEHDRPVPGFLILDQPSQVYYPRDHDYRGDADGDVGVLKDEDRAALSRVYGMIFDATKKLHPKFQVIVMDHANLQEESFRSAVREEWRGGEALVPADWV